MIFGSVCSGIEAASVAWHPLGWRAAFLSEIEAFPRSVLTHHFPDVPLHGDFTTIEAGQYDAIDLLVGGTPCQSFSIAGLRGGLADDRGNLALEYLRLADRLRPRWLVWENVPGVLSSNGGQDFGSILGGMGELGYGFAYRVLDAQHFGVPQRRRRVFVVGHLGDWRRAAAVLFERHSLQGHPAPRREAGKVAPTIPSRSTGGGGLGTDFDCDGGLQVAGTMMARKDSGGWSNSADHAAAGYMIPVKTLCVATGQAGAEIGAEIGAGFRGDGQAYTLEARTVPQAIAFAQNTRDEVRMFGGDGQTVGALAAEPGMKQQSYIAFSSKDHGADAGETSPTLRAGGHSKSHANAGVPPAVAFDTTQITSPLNRNNPKPGDPCHPLAAGSHAPAIAGSEVRRLTPRECERLQGFPDDWTLVPHRGKPAADGPRYKALGNSMAVPVMRWLGERITDVEAISRQEKAA